MKIQLLRDKAGKLKGAPADDFDEKEVASAYGLQRSNLARLPACYVACDDLCRK